HKVFNTSSENLEIIEIQIGKVLSEKDIVRIKDRYKR
ncbi:MAG: mannose-6-phosphate isomerase, partial [bacterium]